MQMHLTKLTAEGLTGESKRGSQERMMTAWTMAGMVEWQGRQINTPKQ